MMLNFDALDNSLRCNHPSQREETNAVLRGLRHGELSAEAGAWSLGQYSFLPRRIVGILSAIRDRLREWKSVYDALDENVCQECGEQTGWIAHFTILKSALLKDLNLDINYVKRDAVTSTFLDELTSRIRSESKEFVVGMAFALEASAHPELRIVCYIINEYWHARGKSGEIIQREAIENKALASQILGEKSPSEYSLEDFFVIHLQEFEVGHRDDLQETIAEFIVTARQADEVTCGYEFILNLMDDWWAALAEMASSKCHA